MSIPSSILNYRAEVCRMCKTPCEFQKNEEWRSNNENQCPQSKWGKFLTFRKVPMKGLGDLVAKFAEPIAGAVDAVAGTKLKGCAACAKRRQMMNHLVPFGQRGPDHYKK